MKKLLVLLLILGFVQTYAMDELRILVKSYYDFCEPDFYVYIHKNKTIADLNAEIAKRTRKSPEEQILESWTSEVYDQNKKLRNLDIERQGVVRLKLKPKQKIISTPQKPTPSY